MSDLNISRVGMELPARHYDGGMDTTGIDFLDDNPKWAIGRESAVFVEAVPSANTVTD